MFKSLDEAKDKCRGFLLGTAIGDAMGVPFEGLPPLDNISEEKLFNDFVVFPINHRFLQALPVMIPSLPL